MTGKRPDDDPELRALLDSIGLTEDVPETPESARRAEEMIERVMQHPRDHEPPRLAPSTEPVRRRRVGVRRAVVAVAAACVLGVVGSLFATLWFGAEPAQAQTPPLLRFSGVDPTELPSGEPAGALLRGLADRVREQAPPADLPVQHLVLSAWWAHTDNGNDELSGTRTVLVPTRVEVYQHPNGDRRSIERRGPALGLDGRVSDEVGSWSDVPALVDETVANDRGAEYPELLPEDIERLRNKIAPVSDCQPSPGGCILGAISNLQLAYVVSPEVTARLWEVAAGEPSIRSLGTTTDRLGRHAVAIGAPDIDTRSSRIVLIDPETGQFLGSETILVAPDSGYEFDPPAVLDFTALVESDRIAKSDVPDDSTTTRY